MGPRLLAIAAFLAAAVPAAYVYFGVQPVATMIYPVLVGALPLASRSAYFMRVLALVASALMAVLVILGALSVGFLFVPSLVLLLLTALAARQLSDSAI
jgi:hypothetical protein